MRIQYLATGVAIGAALAVALRRPEWLALGAAFGLAFASLGSRRGQGSTPSDPPPGGRPDQT